MDGILFLVLWLGASLVHTLLDLMDQKGPEEVS